MTYTKCPNSRYKDNAHTWEELIQGLSSGGYKKNSIRVCTACGCLAVRSEYCGPNTTRPTEYRYAPLKGGRVAGPSW